MADALTFMMGKFPAPLPGGLRYCRNHMWCQTMEGDLVHGRHRFGFTSYAIRLMQDVYFLEWTVNLQDLVRLKQGIGNIESSKAQSELFAPIAGTICTINEELLKDPSAINVDTYGIGWLFEIQGDSSSTMDVQQYYNYLDSNWENTQRILKQQVS